LEEEKALVPDDSATNIAAKLVLCISRLGEALVVRKPVAGIQYLVADKFVSLAMPRVAAALGTQIKNSARQAAPFWSEIVGLHLELANRVLGRNQDRQIDVTNIQRLSVEVLRALVGKRTTYLEVTPGEWILPGRCSACSALQDD
jgi:hypothetical protein